MCERKREEGGERERERERNIKFRGRKEQKE